MSIVRVEVLLQDTGTYVVAIVDKDGTRGSKAGIANIDTAMDEALRLVDVYMDSNAPNVTYDRIRKENITTDHLVFEQGGTSDSGKTLIVHVRSKGIGDILLGKVQWRAPWRRYVFSPHPGLTLDFDAECLRDIAAFTTTLTLNHRRANRAK